MKINIKSLLTGTTLVVASTTGIMADPPKGLKLIPNETITHPVFGKMKVISHKEDIDFYHQKVKDPNERPYENEYDEKLLAENFIKYVLNADSLKQVNVPQAETLYRLATPSDFKDSLNKFVVFSLCSNIICLIC